MTNMTSFERISRTLNHQPVDHIGAFESFWPETGEIWSKQSSFNASENMILHFDLDMILAGWPKLTVDLDFEPKIIEETDEWQIILDGNGATLKRFKAKSGVPEHMDFFIKDSTNWPAAKAKLTDETKLRDRIDFKEYREFKKLAKENNKFFCWRSVNVFEQMHPIAGHEHMLMGMALEPDWIKDMADTYSDLTIKLQKILFAEEGKPDGVWFYEDMGFKERPFMSPTMYDEMIKPYHKKTFDYAHSIGCKVIVHSCGFVEPLIPGLIEAGMDCLQAMERKAGMDPLRIHKNFGDKIALIGGFDIRILEKNDRTLIDQELNRLLPTLTKNNGYILHSDHSIPQSVNYETYKYFLTKARELTTK